MSYNTQFGDNALKVTDGRRNSHSDRCAGLHSRHAAVRFYADQANPTVEIHRKPGYDPVELFLDPDITSPKLAIGKRLLMRKMGFRALMDVIPLDATLVRGSHGRAVDDEHDGPLIISDRAAHEG